MKNKLYLPLALGLTLVIVVLALIYEASYEARWAGAMGFPLDDSWIFWVFAKNLATGAGFSFNPGEPVLGSTSILWVLVLAGSYLLTHSVVFISKFWGVIFSLLAVFLTYRICLFHTREKMVASLAALSFALAPAVILGAISGMETSLATLLVCLTLFFHLKELGQDQKMFLAPLFGALCFAARPELISLYPLLLIHGLLFPVRGERRRVVPVIFRKLVIFGLFLCPSFLLGYIVSGSLLPNTLAAKALDSGLLWAIKNASLDEAVVSLSLNPFIWGGTMLVTLVCLNFFWAFFWGNGLVLSFFRKETLIYPLVFLVVPIFRGVVAPVGNTFSGEHRYVSFLFPLLAIFFVIGWERLRRRSSARSSNKSLRRGLLVVAGAFSVLAVFFYANPLVSRDALLGFFSRYYFPALKAKSLLFNFSDLRLIFCFVVIFVAGATLIGTTRLFAKASVGRRFVWGLLIAGAVLQAGFLLNRVQRYAVSVKNINQMQVHLGRWVGENLPPGSLLAINDVGAIKFFGNRRCVDLEGLVTPQIVPYKIWGKDSYVVYLNKHRPDYFLIFPIWYPSVSTYLGLWKRVSYDVALADNVACGGGGYMIVARPDWQLFDRTFKDSDILNLEPQVPRKSLRRRWYDAQLRQELAPDWKVYEDRGKEAEKANDFRRAERNYKKAESYDPQTDSFYLTMAVFYHSQGDQAKAELAFRKLKEYQFFPFPDYSPMIGR